MVVLRILEVDLTPGIEHIATSWELATDLQFKNIVCESHDDKENKNIITFDEVLDPSIKYYGRAKLLLSSGYTIDSNIDIFVPKNINDIELDKDLPTIVQPPMVRTTSNRNNHSISGFDIIVSGYSVSSTAKHIATTYIIDDIDGNIILDTKPDVNNLNSLHIPYILLEPGKIYRVRALLHSSSNDISTTGTYTIVTGVNKIIKLKNRVLELNTVNDNLIEIFKYPNMSLVEYKLYQINDKGRELIFTETKKYNNVENVTIPKNKIKDNTVYLLTIKSNLDDVEFATMISTYN